MGRPHPLLIELAAERIPDGARPLNPKALLESAFEHGMHGLLWSSSADGPIHLPREQLQLLTARDLATQAHHERLWETLQDVQMRLERRGVRTAAVKGVTAEDRWYGR